MTQIQYEPPQSEIARLKAIIRKENEVRRNSEMSGRGNETWVGTGPRLPAIRVCKVGR